MRVQVDLITIDKQSSTWKKENYKEFTSAYFYPTVERLAEFPWNEDQYSLAKNRGTGYRPHWKINKNGKKAFKMCILFAKKAVKTFE